MIKYRGLGYTLEDSMATYREFKNLSELKDFIKTKIPKCKYIRIDSYHGPDERIGWSNTNVIMVAEEDKRYYPSGFICVEGDENETK